MPADLAAGAWVEPTIWTGLPETAAAVREEISGRAATSAPFDDENEVVRLPTPTTTGWRRRSGRPIWPAPTGSPRIEVGIAWINSWFLRDLRVPPSADQKQSGIGREGGVHSLEFYTETRNICVKL